MPAIYWGKQAYRRRAGSLPELRLVNMFVEAAPTGEEGVALLSRPGLTEHAERGSGPIRGMFTKDGVFGGDMFVVSGNTLYRGATALGSISGSGPVSIAGRAGEVLVAAGGPLYSYNGTDLVAVTFPDDASVTAVIFHDGLFIALRAGTHRYHWSAVNDGRDWGGVDYASAESSPDSLFDLRVINDTLWLFGPESIEPWSNNGNADLPYSRIEQRVVGKGVIASGCVVELDNSLFFCGHDGIAYRLADVPQRISDHGIEERIKASAEIAAFGLIHDGHSFFCLRLDTATYAFDAATGQWCEFASYGRDNFRARCAAVDGRTTYLGDDEAGSIWSLSGYQDGSGPLERLFTAAIPIKGGTLPIDNLNFEVDVGRTPLLTGQGSDPVVEMRSSRDAGATWGAWRSAAMGGQGKYRARPQWRRCGTFDYPGGLFEGRCTDPVDFRLSSVTINEAGGGRAR
jgi:hypothetical protein